MACQWWAEKSLFSTINISLYVGVLDVMIIHNSGIRFKALMLGVLWPVVHITQHPEPMYPAVANTSSNSCLGDVCQSQLWPMGSSHTLSHSINSNRYLTQMCHAYPDIAFTLNWHNSRGNITIHVLKSYTKSCVLLKIFQLLISVFVYIYNKPLHEFASYITWYIYIINLIWYDKRNI